MVRILKWIFVSFVLIAPYIEMVRVAFEYQISPLTFSGESTDFNKLLSLVISLKYFYLLYVAGLVTGIRKGLILNDDGEIGAMFFTLAYLVVILFSFIVLLAFVIPFGLIIIKMYPFVSILLSLAGMSLIFTRKTLLNIKRADI